MVDLGSMQVNMPVPWSVRDLTLQHTESIRKWTDSNHQGMSHYVTVDDDDDDDDQ